jgi:hypothetical protein
MLYRTLKFSTTFEELHYITADEVKMISGVLYTPIVAEVDGIELNSEGGSNSMQIKLPANFDRASLFLKDEVVVRVLQQEYDTETFEFKTLFKGVIKSANVDIDYLNLDCYPSIASPSSGVPSAVYSGYCQHSLYSQGNANKVACGVDRAKHTFESEVVSVDGEIVGIAVVSGSLRDGALLITTDVLKGAHLTVEGGGSRYVVDIEQVGSIWEVRLSGDVLWAVGQVVKVTLGCDKSDVQCEGKFGNVINFFGFRRIPGINPFTTALRVKMG